MSSFLKKKLNKQIFIFYLENYFILTEPPVEVGSVGIDVDGGGGGGTGWWCVAAVSLSIGDITVTLPAVPSCHSCCLGQIQLQHYTD